MGAPYLSFLFNAAAVHVSSRTVSKVGTLCAVCGISELAAAPSQSAACADMVRARGALGPKLTKLKKTPISFVSLLERRAQGSAAPTTQCCLYALVTNGGPLCVVAVYLPRPGGGEEDTDA